MMRTDELQMRFWYANCFYIYIYTYLNSYIYIYTYIYIYMCVFMVMYINIYVFLWLCCTYIYIYNALSLFSEESIFWILQIQKSTNFPADVALLCGEQPWRLGDSTHHRCHRQSLSAVLGAQCGDYSTFKHGTPRLDPLQCGAPKIAFSWSTTPISRLDLW